MAAAGALLHPSPEYLVKYYTYKAVDASAEANSSLSGDDSISDYLISNIQFS